MLNKITLAGRLVRDPERRGNDPEKPIAYLRLAVDRSYKRDGEPEADFFDVSAFGRQAETILNNLKKGSLIAVVGEMHFCEWADKQTGVKKYGSEVHLREVHFLEKKEKAAAPAAQQLPQGAPVSASQRQYASAPMPQAAPMQYAPQQAGLPPFGVQKPAGAGYAYPQPAQAATYAAPAAFDPDSFASDTVPF